MRTTVWDALTGGAESKTTLKRNRVCPPYPVYPDTFGPGGHGGGN